jgi:acetyl esterase/lipase
MSTDVIPVERITASSRDGHQAWALVRRPPGPGPFPAIVLLHGGAGEWAEEKLQRAVLSPLPTWFLHAGYVVVQATFRLKMTEMLRPEALWDCLALVEKTKTLRGVDPESVVVWGTSGGGNFALEVAGETRLAAAAAWEPGTQLFAGIPKPDGEAGYGKVFANPRSYYTEERYAQLRSKLRKIHCPVFIDHGGVHPLKNMNFSIFLPEMMAAGVRVVTSVHPGMDHGTFYNAFPGRIPYIRESFEEYRAFFRLYLKRQPIPMDPKHLQWIPDTPAPATPEVK